MYCKNTRCWELLCNYHLQGSFTYCCDPYCFYLLPCSTHALSPSTLAYFGEEKFPELTVPSREFLFKLDGFLKSKALFDETAARILQTNVVVHQKDVKDEDGREPHQCDHLGRRVTSWPQLFNIASVMLLLFEESMRAFLQECGLNPEQILLSPAENTPHNPYKVFMLGPLKREERAQQKVDNEYTGDWSRVLDVVRCSFILITEADLNLIMEKLERKEAQTDESNNGVFASSNPLVKHVVWKTLRMKNRFARPAAGGYRDVMYSIRIEVEMQDGSRWSHICEVQLQLLDIYVYKEADHKFYEYFREYFCGDTAVVTKSMNTLRGVNMQQDGMPIDGMLMHVLHGNNLKQLKLMADLVIEIMGDVKLACVFRKRIMELEGSLESQRAYAEALVEQSDYQEAKSLLSSIVKSCRDQLGPQHPTTFDVILEFGRVLRILGELSKSTPFLQDAYDSFQQASKSDVKTIEAINEFALLLSDLGIYKEQETLFQLALMKSMEALGPKHFVTLGVLNNIARLLHRQGKYEQARKVYEDSLAGHRKTLGNGHWRTLTLIDNLGSALRILGEYEKARPLLREALEGRKARLGPKHHSTLISMHNSAMLFIDVGEFAEAETLLREVVEEFKLLLGPDHSDTRIVLTTLEDLLQRMNKPSEPRAQLQEAETKGNEEKVDDWEPDILRAIEGLTPLDSAGDVERIKIQREFVALSKQLWGDAHELTLTAVYNLASNLAAADQFDEAERICLEALSMTEKALGETHKLTLLAVSNLQQLFLKKGRLLEAEFYSKRTARGCETIYGRKHPHTETAFSNLATLLLAQGKIQEAVHIFTDVWNNYVESFGELHPSSLAAMHNLSSAFCAAGQQFQAQSPELSFHYFREAEKHIKKVINHRVRQHTLLHVDVISSLEQLKEIFTLQQRTREVITVGILVNSLSTIQKQYEELAVSKNNDMIKTLIEWQLAAQLFNKYPEVFSKLKKT